MTVVSVVIQSLEDVANGKPIVKGIDGPDDYTQATNVTVGILEAGTVAGRTSVMFVLQTEDGKPMVGECTANQFEGLIGVFRAAVERFGK